MAGRKIIDEAEARRERAGSTAPRRRRRSRPRVTTAIAACAASLGIAILPSALVTTHVATRALRALDCVRLAPVKILAVCRTSLWRDRVRLYLESVSETLALLGNTPG